MRKGEAFDPTLYNEDLAPIPRERRNWSWVNYSTVWMGMVHNVVAYTTAAGLVAAGMSPWQALGTVAAANVILILAMWVNSIAGAKYGLPFPVLLRAAFGYRGAQVPVIIRGFVAIFWFAVQTYLGSLAVGLILGTFIPGWSSLDVSILGMGLNGWISFLIFWGLHAYVIFHGMERIKFFELWAGPLVIVAGLVLVGWAVSVAGGVAPLFDQPSRLAPGEFWPLFALSVTALVSVWSTLVLNIPDFTRFSRSQGDQMVGQAIGLPLTTIIFSFMSIAITAGSTIAFGRPISAPDQLLLAFDNPAILLIGAATILIATLSVNVAANIVSPAYDLVNLFPRRLDFVRAGLISILIGFLFVPWLWMDNPETIFAVLGYIGGALGPVAGIMIADFYLVRRRNYDLASFYDRSGQYAYRSGWNTKALIATALGLAVAFVGLVVPPLSGLLAYTWFLGLAVAFVAYAALMRSESRPAAEAEPAMEIADELG
ncbi:nitrate reductase [Rubrobacter marinus]|uniref:Nitrate reductase n=1 Tax=Rubrobacter marinus TaxID=2653852 RepID=A0A6G8Q276_9ACTN|nr:nitrate reductase [Rubrobacter marinus]